MCGVVELDIRLLGIDSIGGNRTWEDGCRDLVHAIRRILDLDMNTVIYQFVLERSGLLEKVLKVHTHQSHTQRRESSP